MKFKIENWTINDLLSLLSKGKLDLNPPYQRNPIWTKQTQKQLIYSIKQGQPIPNLFLLRNGPDTFEMVDGQQRTRALKLYQTTNELDFSKDDSEYKIGLFLLYEIPVTIITQIDEGEFIEEFYYMVNSSGNHLNRPEKLKAHYFDTTFLKLVEEITNGEFQKLNIIPINSQKRMMDRDLIEELCALILHGITDKKNQVDKLYENDISSGEEKICRSKFSEVLNHLIRFDSIHSIRDTRYRQRNDFYTLFGFLKDNLSVESETLDYFYKVLLQLEKGIRPNKSACRPLAEYAFNCVSQSNSSSARQVRLEILNDLLLNLTVIPSTSQKDVIEYYPFDGEYLITKGKYTIFNIDILQKGIDWIIRSKLTPSLRKKSGPVFQ